MDTPVRAKRIHNDSWSSSRGRVTRPHSTVEFDASFNASTAWTLHQFSTDSELSDEEESRRIEDRQERCMALTEKPSFESSHVAPVMSCRWLKFSQRCTRRNISEVLFHKPEPEEFEAPPRPQFPKPPAEPESSPVPSPPALKPPTPQPAVNQPSATQIAPALPVPLRPKWPLLLITD
ncbi:hypothetical protein BDP27DRAFT_1358824 [Rhodocollybia butyracea]|uniref:Uncharacterized protein n=1 Tax=Rhodocollybia butyracea TaxID=206335 RepID=A0A9P5PYS6_9AGAR|nr:hypothetical protein BDP27DRAFT_1358824 [Rhodocollybia butyracea]